MKEKQYSKLLVESHKIHTATSFQRERISEFADKCSPYCAAIISNLESMADILEKNPEPDTVSRLKISLEKLKSNLKKDLESPALDYKKTVDKLEKDLNEKILPLLGASLETCAFDLAPIRNTVEQCKLSFTAINAKLDLCLGKIIACQAKVASLDQELQVLDLPNSIDRTTKHIEKVATELGELQSLLSFSPNKSQYQLAFLPLSTALAKLKLQTEELVEENQSTTQTIRPSLNA